MKSVLPLSAVFLSGFLALTAPAQEWTRFRGEGGNGVNPTATFIPASFTEKDYRWKIELPGAGTSSPVLWGSKLFITSEGAAEGKRAVLCIDSATGKQLWAHDDSFKPYGHHKFNNFASSTPTVDAKQLYVSWTSGDEMHVLALTHEGKKVWEANLGFFSEEHGSGASPIVVGKVLVVSKDHSKDEAFLAGLSVTDGKVLWKLPRKTARSAFSTPLQIEDKPGHAAVVFSSNPNALTCVDPATGKELWSHDFAQKTEFRAVGSPAFADGVIFSTVGQGMGGRDGAAVTFKNGKPETAWELPKAIPYVPTPLGIGSHFFMLNDGGILTCLKASSGEVLYSERVAENAYSSPVAAGNRIYCISRKGDVTAVKAGPKFEVLGKSSLGEACESTPAIANGMMFIRTAKHLIAVGGVKPEAKNFFRGKGVDVELISEVTSVQPGQTFTVGFRLNHAAKYHTYWKNPGLAGVKFGVEWTLPEGWKADEIQYEMPDKVYMADILTHGYERDVIHLVNITPPATITGEKEVALKVKAAWMCCAQACHPTFCDIELDLPIASSATMDPVWHKAFEGIRADQAQPTNDWKFTAIREGNFVRLSGERIHESATKPSSARTPIFFSDNNLICSHEEQKWSWKGESFSAVLPISTFPPKDTSKLTGLLFSEVGWDTSSSRKYVTVDIPITAPIGATGTN